MSRHRGNAPGPDRPPQFGIQSLDRIRGVQNPPDIDGESVERDDFGPGASPALADRRIFLAPVALFEGGQRVFAGVSIDRAINRFEGSGNRFAIFPGNEVEAVTQQVNNAGLHRCERKDGGDRLREILQAVDDGYQHVFDAAVLQLVQDAQPEFRSLILLGPPPEDFLRAIGPEAERDTCSRGSPGGG